MGVWGGHSQEEKDAAYRLKLEAQAHAFKGAGNWNYTDEEIEEIRRWEGPEAARIAEARRSEPFAFTQISSQTSSRNSPVTRATYDPSQVVPTNVMAILAIIFGLGGGLLGIVFGHIALSQIDRTGEAGRGLAYTGLIFGYLGLVALIVVLISVVR
jgi:hypothetical protein